MKVRDVSGAGDTVAAVLAVMLAAGADFESAMRAANAAASVVVGKSGTATVSAAELRARILPAATLASEEKIVFDWRELDARLTEWRAQDLRIGFTNGVFDLLHPGHIKVLAQSRAACDRLVVGLNSDASVKRLKGKDRPIQPERARAEVLAGLEAVDLVVVFEQDTPLELIQQVRPTVLVKGGDYRPDQVVGREVVKAQGGEVIVVDLVPGLQHDAHRREIAQAQEALAHVEKWSRLGQDHAQTVAEWQFTHRTNKSTPSSASFSAARLPAISSRSAPIIRPKARRPGISSRPAGPACWSSRSPISPRSW